jgi:FkbM family methyltransferase
MEFIESREIKEYYLSLNMIVKNEGHIIKDTLTKLLTKVPSIDYWVISDTGSTDKTKEIIIEFFKERNIQGEIYDDVWKDFGYNRTLALEHAYKKSKFLLVFDADDEICGDFVLPDLKLDSYHFQFGDANGVSYTRTQIVNNNKRWKYVGVLHEIITCIEQTHGNDIIKGNYYTISGKSGARSLDPNKYLKDALILEKAYDEAKQNGDTLCDRYGFYCANSYYDSGKWEDAIKWYKITLDNKNWDQEKYVSCLRIYYCYNALNQKETGMFYLVKSFSYDKERVECLYELVVYYCCNELNDMAYNYYNMVKSFYNKRYLTESLNHKLFLDVGKANLFLPFYMILICDKVKDYETLLQMYKIIFTKKHIERSKHYIGNMLYNLQFFIENTIFQNDTTFLKLFQEYIDFLVSINYPIYDHNDFMIKYEKYGVKIPKFTDPVFSLDECSKSKNILVYTGYAPSKWNYTFSLSNALGGSETAISCLTKNFPDDYTIYVTGDVEEEKVDNVTYIHLNNLNNLIKTTPFHTIIVSRYLNFYQLYRNFSAYQTYIWAHDITLYAYGTDLTVESILTKWSAKITGCICQTQWHKDLFLSSFPQLKDKIGIINNGINANMFSNTKAKKIANRFIYTSCSERGLYKLTQLWSSILEHLPDAELVISSYNNFPKSEEDNKILEIINKTPSIKHMGKLNRTELYDLMSSAEYWLYPSYFQETSCITSLELLASEVICLYYPVAGLVNTLGDYGIPVSEGNELTALLNLSNKRKMELKKKGKEYALSCSWQNRATEWSKKMNLINLSVEYKIKIINLKSRTERKKYMTEQFFKNDITNYDFFEAIDGKKIKESEEIQFLFEENDFNYKKGVIGCTLSHIHLWNELIHDNVNNFYVILEDDIELCDNFKQQLDYACKLFYEKNLEHLSLGEYNSNKQFPSSTATIDIYTKDLYKEGHITFAYIISKSALIKAFEYINSCSIKCALDNPQAFGYILNYSAINYKLVNCKQINEFGTDIQNNNIGNYFEFTKNPHQKFVTISFCDWWRSEYCGGEFDTNNNYFTNLLRKYGNYDVKIVEPNQKPDILFYSIFGDSHKNLNAKRKVFFSGEPYGQRNEANFNITFDTNSHKNTRLPLWLCYFSNSILDECIKRKNNKTNNINYEKRIKFCSFIASGPGLRNNRKEFIDKLSKYKIVDCGGRYLNNIGGEVPIGLNCSGKIEHNNNYKFATAFESDSYPGYVTEKICDIYKSNCIPIYWGHQDVIKDFNPSTFINANNFKDFDELIEYIKKVDNDEELYASFFKEPVLSPIWIDILTDPKNVFFKNLVDKIVGSKTSLLYDYFRSLDKLSKNVICMPKTTQIDIRDHEGTKINIEYMEKDEQDLANKYILEDDIVLELGARYGSVSCIINNKLNNKNNQVVVEPDDRVWYALEENKKRNNCEFNIVKGFISNKKLDLTNLDNCYGYGSTFIENSNTKIPSYTLNEIKKIYNLKFNVLVADCEGFLEVFFDENPELYDEIRLIIFEEDYREKCNYNKIKYELRKRNFTQLLEGNQNVWVKYI